MAMQRDLARCLPQRMVQERARFGAAFLKRLVEPEEGDPGLDRG